MSGAPRLSSGFLDWWLAPWQLAHAPALWPNGAGEPGPLARRHGYRMWCDAAGVPADLPERFEPVWQGLAALDSTALDEAACLYAGLLAARAHDAGQLALLPLAQRRWCMSVAQTQPLVALSAPVQPGHAGQDALVQRGLAELARALADGFPGLWPRLRLLVPPGRLLSLAGDGPGTAQIPVTAPAALARVSRCWSLCAAHAGASRARLAEAACAHFA